MSKRNWAGISAMLGLFSAWALLLNSPIAVEGQEPAGAGGPVAQSSANPETLGQQVTFSIDGPTQRLEMVIATSRILTLEQKIPRILVANPDVVRATPISPNQVQVSALTAGVTQLNVWDENQNLYTVDVVVTPDARALQMLIKSEFPDAAVRVRALAQSVYLTGYVPSPGHVASIVRIAEDFYPKVINNMTVGGVQQILLKTKVMEVSRTKLRQAGFDWQWHALIGNTSVGIVQSSSELLNPAGVSNLTDTVNFGIVDGSNAFYGYLDALRRNDLVKILAEPQLTTVSGRAASFHSGGQFAILVPQSLGTVSIEYKNYGTRVDFVPIVLGNGDIRLEVRPSVSEIDPARSQFFNGYYVPGLRERWVDTAVEMKAGQTLALAGLLQTRTESKNAGLPWLADIPWFGAPFRRVEETVNEVELLILVTPEFVEAVDAEEIPPCGPGESTASPNDVELYFRGYTEVPKCCPDGSCPECQQGSDELLYPQGVHPAPAPAADVPVEAKRPTATKSASATKTARMPTSSSRSTGARNVPSTARKPGLIGPVGYDSLK
jgi:pilus assembly protein CpaC